MWHTRCVSVRVLAIANLIWTKIASLMFYNEMTFENGLPVFQNKLWHNFENFRIIFMSSASFGILQTVYAKWMRLNENGTYQMYEHVVWSWRIRFFIRFPMLWKYCGKSLSFEITYIEDCAFRAVPFLLEFMTALRN